jgi:hypothetical protein
VGSWRRLSLPQRSADLFPRPHAAEHYPNHRIIGACPARRGFHRLLVPSRLLARGVTVDEVEVCDHGLAKGAMASARQSGGIRTPCRARSVRALVLFRLKEDTVYGVLVNALPLTRYDFADMTSGANWPGGIPIARLINISQYREVTMIIRIHARDMTGTGAKLEIAPVAEVPSPDDPAQVFTATAPLVNPVEINNSTTAPSIMLVALPANAGPLVSVYLFVTQGTGTLDTFEATISIDFSMKV